MKINTWQENDGTWVSKICKRTTTIFGYGATKAESVKDAKTTLKNYK